MAPLLRPGSLVLVDTEMREIEVEEWTCEHDRPMYLVEMVIGAAGFIRYLGDCSWSRIHCRGALRNPGLCRRKLRWSAR